VAFGDLDDQFNIEPDEVTQSWTQCRAANRRVCRRPHEPAIPQLTIYCEWSAIVFDERCAGRPHAAVPESLYVWSRDGEPVRGPELQVLHGAEGLKPSGRTPLLMPLKASSRSCTVNPLGCEPLSSESHMHQRAFPD
jgi:hypothetical protein